MNKHVASFINLILACAACSGLGLLILSVVKRDDLSSSFFVKLVLFAIVVILIYGGGLLLDQNKKINLTLATISGGICLLFLEIFMVIFGHLQPTEHQARQLAAEAAGSAYDTRSKLEVMDEFRSNGVPMTPYFIPSFSIRRNGFDDQGGKLYPLAGIANAPQMLGNENGTYITYQSDEFGFNNPPGLHNPELVDMALIGDSFTHGFCVPAEASMAGRLRDSGVRLINLGMGGNSSLLEYATLAEYAAPLKPATVLWFYYEGNDFRDLPFEMRDPVLNSYLDGKRYDLRARQPQIDAALAQYFKAKEAEQRAKPEKRPLPKIISFRTLTLPNLRRMAGFKNEIKPPLEDFTRTMTASKALVDSWGGRLVFVYLPEWQRFAKGKVHDNQFRHKGKVLEIVDQLGLEIVDFSEPMGAHADPLSLFPFRQFGHYNEAGYQLVTDYLIDKLKRGN